MVKPTAEQTIMLSDFVYMYAKDLELERDKKKAPGGGRGFATDTEIAGGGGFGERQLERFEFDPGVLTDSSLSLTRDGMGGGSWDQFAVNKQKFGIESNFKEETYTTKLDVSELTTEQRVRAEKLAREIEEEQRRASGGKWRAADEAEAAGDDQVSNLNPQL